MTEPSASPSWVGKTLEGRYRIEAVLGEGGMGIAYRARDERKRGHPVVIKVPHLDMVRSYADFKKRFEGELSRLIELEHPGIVRIYDLGELSGIPFAVMQYLGGGSLKERLQGQTHADPDFINRWLPTVAAALDFIHERDVLHRDVKPANILFDKSDHVYLGDFGIAKVISDAGMTLQMTSTGLTPGSPPFMPPEAGLDAAPTRAYDQYSLGVVVYWALSGGFPHSVSGTIPVALLVQKLTSPPKPLANLDLDLPRASTDAVMRALSTDPAERFPTCMELATAFAHGFRPFRPDPKALDDMETVVIRPPAKTPPPRPADRELVVDEPPIHAPPVHEPPIHDARPTDELPADVPAAAKSGPGRLVTITGSLVVIVGAVLAILYTYSVTRPADGSGALAELLVEADRLLAAGDWTGARDSFESVLAIMPGHELATSGVGRTHLEEGREALQRADWSDARRSCDAAGRYAPGVPAVEACLSDAQEGLRLDEVEGLLERARAATEAGELATARELYEQVLARDPDHPIAVAAVADPEPPPRPEPRRQAEPSPPPDPPRRAEPTPRPTRPAVDVNALLGRARRAQEARDLTQALELYGRALSVEPGNAEATSGREAVIIGQSRAQRFAEQAREAEGNGDLARAAELLENGITYDASPALVEDLERIRRAIEIIDRRRRPDSR